MDKEKRHRIPNFSYNGVETLVTLVERSKKIFEYKKADAVTFKMKDTEWNKLEIIFNSQSLILRTANQLRSKWESLKKVTKKEYVEEKLNLYKTG